MHRAAAPLLLSLLLACGFADPAHARIGDTPMQIAARYGAAKVVGEQLLYTITLKEVSYQTQIFFDAKGLVSMEIFSRKSPNPTADDAGDAQGQSPNLNGLAELTQADFDLLLTEEENAVPWRKIDATEARQTWISGNNRAFARYQSTNRLFLLFSPSAQPFVPTTKVLKEDGKK